MKYVIETNHLTKQYGHTTVVNDVSINVPKGKIYGLLGRNGAGKTTVMKMLLQLVKTSAGTITLFEKDSLEQKNTIYHKIGSIIETPGFYDNLNAYENLYLLHRLHAKQNKDRIQEVLEIVNLHKEGKKPYRAYSLGMKQRLGIAAAILHEPELLILDEPINGLDPIGITEIRKFLYDLSHTHGITILISSHVLSEIEEIADIVGIMHDGILLEEVTMEELHKRNKKYLEIDVSDVQLASVIITKTFHITNFTIEDKTIKLLEGMEIIGDINQTLVEHHVTVTRIHIYEEQLETYFSNLIGGEGIA